jgi:hypothetical protein
MSLMALACPARRARDPGACHRGPIGVRPGGRRGRSLASFAARVLWLSLLSLAAPAQAVEPSLAITWKAPPAATEVSWRGIPNLDGSADAAGGILYPAPSLLGFLASVLAHAAVSSAVQSAEQQKAQREADVVLAPFAASLKTWTADALWRAALSKPGAPAAATLADSLPADGWRAEATPRFALAPDAGTLVLDLGAKLQGPGTTGLDLVIRVVSTPPSVPDWRKHWADDNARTLRETAAIMLAHALALAGDEARRRASSGAEQLPFQTHRYRLGTLMRSERSQLLATHCDRVVLRTLRGGLLSAPAWPPPAAAVAAADAASATPTASAASAASAPSLHSATALKPSPDCPAVAGL